MIQRDDDELRRALSARLLPPTIERWRVVISPDDTVESDESTWADALVLVERGTLHVTCRGGAQRSFRSGSLLALDWLRPVRLSCDGPEAVSLLALRRTDIRDRQERRR